MFSLIITLIAIALVAALALATLYYGGPIFNQGADRAQAAKIESQGQQIMGALELYHAEKGVYPNSLADLVTDDYLKSIPTAAAEQAQLVAAALAATGTWSLASPGQPVIVMAPVSLATCKAFNSSNLGVAGVLQMVHSTKLKQCVGTDVNNLKIVQPKAVADLLYVSTDVTAAVQIGNVLPTVLPPVTDTTLNGWLDPGAVLGPVVSFFEGTGGAALNVMAFADTLVGQASSPVTVTLTNTGASALNFAATSASVAAPFAISANTCAGTLAANASCSVSVTFSPEAAQAYTGASNVLQLNATNLTIPGLPMTGTGTAPAGGPVMKQLSLTLTETGVDFENSPPTYNLDWSLASVGAYPLAEVILNVADPYSLTTLLTAANATRGQAFMLSNLTNETVVNYTGGQAMYLWGTALATAGTLEFTAQASYEASGFTVSLVNQGTSSQSWCITTAAVSNTTYAATSTPGLCP